MSEMFDVYYPDGSYRGVFPRSECHGNPELLHHVAHVVVLHPETGAMLLQKRSMLSMKSMPLPAKRNRLTEQIFLR